MRADTRPHLHSSPIPVLQNNQHSYPAWRFVFLNPQPFAPSSFGRARRTGLAPGGQPAQGPMRGGSMLLRQLPRLMPLLQAALPSTTVFLLDGAPALQYYSAVLPLPHQASKQAGSGAAARSRFPIPCPPGRAAGTLPGDQQSRPSCLTEPPPACLAACLLGCSWWWYPAGATPEATCS